MFIDFFTGLECFFLDGKYFAFAIKYTIQRYTPGEVVDTDATLQKNKSRRKNYGIINARH